MSDGTLITPDDFLQKDQNNNRNVAIASNKEFKKYFFFENDTLVEERCFKIVDGKEIPWDDSPNQYSMNLSQIAEKPIYLDVLDSKTEQKVSRLERAEQLELFPDLSFQVKASEIDQWNLTVAPLKNCPEVDKQKFKEAIIEHFKTNQTDIPPSITIQQVAKTIEMILANDANEIPSDFYKSIDPNEEFGISRVVADKVYNLPRMLDNATLLRQGDTTTYIIQAEIKDSKQNSIKLEHRLQATCPEEAERTAQLVLKRLRGMQLKIWTACWKMANTKSRYTFTCRLSDLMNFCNPQREAHFNSKERLEFYEHLRSLENTKFVFTKRYKKGKVDKYESYEIRLLEIHRHSGIKDEEAPQEISMTILNTLALQKEKTTFVGVGVKNRTLELHADDAMLANLIQTRKNQNMAATHLKFERESLMEIAGLSLTNKTKKARANRLLIEKLNRLKDKGILLESPSRIKDVISLRVR